jgi:hypothetical protein
MKNLFEHMVEFKDSDNPHYYNIDTLKLLSANHGLRSVTEEAR